MRKHHNELNYQKNLLINDWSLEDTPLYEDISLYDENNSIMHENKKSAARRKIEDYLDSKRLREKDIDIFDEDYLYDED